MKNGMEKVAEFKSKVGANVTVFSKIDAYGLGFAVELEGIGTFKQAHFDDTRNVLLFNYELGGKQMKGVSLPADVAYKLGKIRKEFNEAAIAMSKKKLEEHSEKVNVLLEKAYSKYVANAKEIGKDVLIKYISDMDAPEQILLVAKPNGEVVEIKNHNF